MREPGDGIASALGLDGDLALAIQQDVRHFLAHGFERCEEQIYASDADRSNAPSEQDSPTTPPPSPRSASERKLPSTPPSRMAPNGLPTSHNVAKARTEYAQTLPNDRSAHNRKDSSDSSDVSDDFLASAARGYFIEKRKKFQQTDSSGAQEGASTLPHVPPFPVSSQDAPSLTPNDSWSTLYVPPNVIFPGIPEVDPITQANCYYLLAQYYAQAYQTYADFLARLTFQDAGLGSLQSLACDTFLHQIRTSAKSNEESCIPVSYTNFSTTDGTWEPSTDAQENSIGNGGKVPTEEDFRKYLSQRVLPPALQDIEGDAAKRYLSRLRPIIESFYRDRIEPTLGEVRSRLLEECQWSKQDVDSALPFCARFPDVFRILLPRLGKLPVLCLQQPPTWFEGWVNGDTRDEYKNDVWEALSKFFEDHDIAFEGGVRGAALELRRQALPELSQYSLGELRHIVESALGEKILIHVGQHLRPFHSALKSGAAGLRKERFTKTKRRATAQADDQSPSKVNTSTATCAVMVAPCIPNSSNSVVRARSTSRRRPQRPAAPRDEAATARALAIIAGVHRGRSNISGAPPKPTEGASKASSEFAGPSTHHDAVSAFLAKAHPSKRNYKRTGDAVEAKSRAPEDDEILGDYVGSVKNFNAEKGFGFVTCHAVQNEEGKSDVYIHHKMLGDFEMRPGAPVLFEAFWHKGRLQGRTLRIPPEGTSSRNTPQRMETAREAYQ